MSEARSLTPLSEADYEVIAAAVMETSRGRWFMAEYARRNRQADTTQLLGAISRIERAVGAASQQATATNEPGLREAAALIVDLRVDLERVSGKAGEPASGLAARIEAASASIVAATEHVQEASWGLREAGSSEEFCDALDRSATEIYAATAIIEGAGLQIGKIADTVAMLDSSLRAIADAPPEPIIGDAEIVPSPDLFLNLREAAPLSSYEDIDIVEIDSRSSSIVPGERPSAAKSSADRKMGTMKALADDIVFSEIGSPLPADPAKPAETSEAGLRAIDMLPPAEKLAYFA
ncbi:hypothetical protein [Bosea sp. PAMC 26642]|uniref:hypothetical protein n=1 Tax=Bosea sp. (strain PAMC 26642) TaxID=1792307 RepID=UPI0007704B4C|nr:hypothetical protein [Bosea sp. PAMC 26642]AMJ59168.1 hypothetical protein AXW83_01610 [Bosea sp. PAMC 26642]